MKNITNFLHFRTVIIFAMLSYSLSNFSQGTAKRYVKEKVHTGTIEGITSIKYFDGLGRPCILATNGAADSAKYTYALQVYDEIGHVSENWLPGVCDVTATHDLPDVEAIKSWSIATNGNDTRPYSLTKYDALNNVKSVCGAGSNWSAKAVVTGYAANRAREVKLYRAPLTNNDLTQDGYYAESTLHAKTIKDEDGRTMTVFTDYNGHKILERRSGNNDTYYVYNDYGELRFVLSPKYQQNQSIEALAYEYRYDSRGRCVYKRIPGCDPVIYTYDGKGHIATMQDGILRKDGKVRFYMYDHLNRNVITGIGRNFNPEWTEVKKTSIGQGICGTIYVISNAGSGNSQPSGDFEIENVYYYDDYSFLPTFPESIFHEKLDEGNCLYRITGLQTAVSGDGIENTTYDYKTMYYDEWGNCKEEISTSTVWGKKQPVISPIHKEKQILATVQAQSLGISSGVIREMKKRYDTKTVEYSYSGKPKKITVRHFDSLNASNYNYSEEYEYHYNNVDKIKEITHRLTDNTTTQVSSAPKISIAKYEYDDLGRIKTMSHNGRQKLKSTYTYNIRGWKTTCQNSLFSETLEYEQPSVSGAKSMYSGCISAVKWNSATHAQTQSYAYTYDKLNRLTMAIYATSSEGGNRYGEKAKYDQNGNITSFLRRGTTDDDTAGLIDDLSFSYNGNQLTDITDCAPHFPTYKDAFHYIDKGADGGEPGFEYDENGRMTRNSDRDICSIEYNYLNLPVKTTFTDGSTINNTYDAMGNRLSTVSLINSITASKPSAALIGGPTISPFIFTNETVTSYSGNLLYEGLEPSKLFFGTGYVDLKDNCKYYFYITDHLGSVRVVADAQGNAVQHNEYYAFGGLMSDMCVGADKQRYKFQGKELDRSHGLNWNFHGARFADLLTGSWTTADPLAEAFYNMSPYSFCNSNTAMFTDPNGKKIKGVTKRDISLFVSDISNILGNSKFANLLKLIKIKGLFIDYIDKSLWDATIANIEELSFYEHAFLSLLINTINSKKLYVLEYVGDDEPISSTAFTYIMRELTGGNSIGEPILKGKNITQLWDGGVTFKQSNTKVHSVICINKTCRPACTAHEVFGHGIALMAGLDSQANNENSVRAENLVRRLLGIDLWNGANHPGFEFISPFDALPLLNSESWK